MDHFCLKNYSGIAKENDTEKISPNKPPIIPTPKIDQNN